MGGSFGSGFGFGFSLGSGDFGFLLGYGFGLSFVLSLFFGQTCLSLLFLLVGFRSLYGFDFLALVSLPGIEATLCFGFVKSAFLDAALKVFHQHHALA